MNNEETFEPRVALQRPTHDAPGPEKGRSRGLRAVEALPRSHPLRILVTAAAMVGLRLDHSPRQSLCAFVGIVASAALAFAWTGTRASNLLDVTSHRPPAGTAVAYLVGTWAVYYVGHSLVYLLGLHRALRRRLGDEAAYEVYATALCVVYFNVVWSQVPFLSAMSGSLDLSSAPTRVFLLSLALFLVSFSFKLWATLHLGIDGFYYRDMFLEARRAGGPVVEGPYAFFSDPIYSVGYCPVYAGALAAHSAEGLAAGVAFHVGIFAFNLIAERPFVRRVYGSHGSAAALPLAPAPQAVRADAQTRHQEAP